jgi:hypothetical protein
VQGRVGRRLTIAAAMTIGAWAAPASAEARPVCGPTSGAETVKQEQDVRIYLLRRGAWPAYGCMRGGRSHRLDSPEDGPADWALREKGPIKIAGRFAAFVVDGDGSEGALDYFFTDVVRVNLTTGRLRYSSCPAITDEGCDDRMRITGLFLKRNGSFAFMRTFTDGTGTEARRIDGRGDRELDRGPEVEPGSLRPSADRRLLSWRRAGATRTASFR